LNDIILSINNITKSFSDVTALNDFSISINKGEFISILGPSGCGKTTLLRIIAGLEVPDGGNLILDGVDITNFPPEKRNVNTVFQNYALFPHMNVYDNIAYGLKLSKLKREVINQKVEEALKLVRLTGYEKRRIHQLSGGQKQRVAIARALVLKPQVLLLDEPLGALDHKLRLSMQEELKELKKSSGTTFIYVTHDQDEALNLSDKIILMNNAQIQQVGTPNELYNKPNSLFAARFIGEANILKGELKNTVLNFGIFSISADVEDDSSVYAIIRPEDVMISKEGIPAKVVKQSMKGSIIVTEVDLGAGQMVKIHGFDTPSLSSGAIVNITVKNNIHYVYE